ncbi:kinesin [Coccidioides immitis RMSCC 2394]|uniref:Kinesin n=1 Tax=Coccidioides immitis RMSCC 2394 TaxID=404692 RepID=A0A0J6YRQ4_COCIT|nr:kinesin [Coccidioides immitis RMSCC 2394]
MFSLAVRPVSAKRAADLWRMNTQNDYVKGEELLSTWSPRKVSLVRDYIRARKRRQRVAEIDAARGSLSTGSLTPLTNGWSTPSRGAEKSQRQEKLLRKYLDLWSTKKDLAETILVKGNTEPPVQGAAFARRTSSSAPPKAPTNVSSNTSLSGDAESTISSHISSSEPSKPRFLATIQHIPKNPSSSKAGCLYTPDDTNTHWVRRFVELRLPYLHVHSVPDGDEINAINLRNSHIDHEPDFARLLGPSSRGANNERSRESMRGRPNVFAVYGTQNTYLFAARTEAQKIEWILKIDQGYFSGARAELLPSWSVMER